MVRGERTDTGRVRRCGLRDVSAGGAMTKFNLAIAQNLLIFNTYTDSIK